MWSDVNRSDSLPVTSMVLPFPQVAVWFSRTPGVVGNFEWLLFKLPIVRASRHDLQSIIRQRSLQSLRLIPRRAHPDIALLISG